MTSLIDRNRLTVSTALILCVSLAWLLGAREALSPAASAMLAAMLTVMVTIAISFWKKGKPGLDEAVHVHASVGPRTTPECL